ncbi:NUDIX hydrolase [Streptosporangium sp. NPDC000396]|uniref:NUDIX hydrolase n=1 Tax=Streptosporangium sp. NPDC000396 TaxID=3366185 RepID=UPI0036AA7F56
MKNYVMELRALVGTRPLILAGTSVVIVDNEERVLLMRRTDTGDWGLPGGLMEPGESFEQTGHREVLEETGLRLVEMELIGVFSGPEYFYTYPNGDQVFNVTAAYRGRAVGSPTCDATEADELRFFPVDALPDDILPPEQPILAAYVKSRTAER